MIELWQEFTIEASHNLPQPIGMPVVHGHSYWIRVYIKTEEDGTTKIVRRHSAVNMRANVVMPKSAADDVLIAIRRVLDKPVAWIASDAPGYAGLNVFGLGSASLNYAGPEHASLDINVKGLI